MANYSNINDEKNHSDRRQYDKRGLKCLLRILTPPYYFELNIVANLESF